MKRLTGTRRKPGLLVLSALLILALAACVSGNSSTDTTSSGSQSSTSDGSQSSNNATSSGSNSTSGGNSTGNHRSLNLSSGSGGGNANNKTWNVTIKSITSPASYNGYTPSAGNRFLLVDAFFKNVSSQEQILGPGVFVITDNRGQKYVENRASNRGQTFTVAPNQTIETQTAFVLPDSGCNSTLTFIGNSNSSGLQWNLIC